MNSGEMRHRVVFQTNTPTQNASGELVDSWATTATVWAAVEPLAGMERYSNTVDQRVAEATLRIRIRYRSDITERMRCTWNGNPYDITAVLNQWGRMRELHVMVREVIAGTGEGTAIGLIGPPTQTI